MSARTVVVGGGLAGITAALELADAGREVVLLEARPRLGGLTSSFVRAGLAVDTGQHVFLRCCTAYRGLLGRLGVEGDVELQPRLDIPVRTPSGTVARLRRSGLPAPLHLAAALLRYPLLSPRERLGAARAAMAMRRLDPTDPATDRRSLADWLAEHGQGPRATEALWDLVGLATLNARAPEASLALAATVFQEGLLTAAGAGDIGWSRVPLGRLHGEAAGRALAAAGAEVRTGTKVTRLTREQAGGPGADEGWRVHCRGGADVLADDVVLALPPAATQALAPPGALALPAGWAERLGTSPIVDVHVVYDRRVLAEPFCAGVGTPVQWVFDRTASSGLAAGSTDLDAPAGAQYLAVSLSAAHDLVDTPAAAVRAVVLPALAELLPAARAARVVDSFVTREREATIAPAPGTAALRPGAATGCPGLAVAGAWTATGWPSTMEGAVRSGRSAAQALLRAPVRAARTEAGLAA